MYGAVVLLQLDHRGVGEVVLEAEDVADVGSPPRVHRLVVVADHRHLPVLLGEQLDQHVLGPVGVLVLVHQDVAEEVAVVGQPLGEELQDVDRAHEQVVEVQGVGLEQAGLVAPVDRRGDVVEAARRRSRLLRPSQAGPARPLRPRAKSSTSTSLFLASEMRLWSALGGKRLMSSRRSSRQWLMSRVESSSS